MLNLEQMRIQIITPAKPGSLHGNMATALRWQSHLIAMGCTVDVLQSLNSEDCDTLIALHAQRSHDSIKKFRTLNPSGRIILIMTGTDIYRDMRVSAEVLDSLETANEVVVLQELALQSLPEQYKNKTRVIHQSVNISEQSLKLREQSLLDHKPKSNLLISVIGHLRDEKDPFCTVRALSHLPNNSAVKVLHLGQAMSEQYQIQAEEFMLKEARYEWLGQRTHEETMMYLAKSDIMVISSLMEGGAHVVSEAIGLGVPVIASFIDGNIGLLGAHYPAYYEAGSPKALAEQIMQVLKTPGYLSELAGFIQTRRSIVSQQTEFEKIKDLILSN